MNMKCPVCGMKVDSMEFKLKTDRETYVFCSPQCRERYIEQQELYIFHTPNNINYDK